MRTRALVSSLMVALLLMSSCTRAPLPPPNRGAEESPSPPVGLSSTPVPSFGRVFVILMENKEYEQVIGSDDAPYINQLARSYASAGRFYGIVHPSLPNYLALVSGSNQGITNDCPDCSVDARNLVDQLEAHQKSWRAYMEDMPSPCFNGAAADAQGVLRPPLYLRRHNPWMYFADISNSPQRCSQVVPLTQFEADLQAGRLADFVWITPNTVHDMHDGSVRDGDGWLASFLPAILESPSWKENGVIFLLWDEGESSAGCCGDAAGGHTPALVITARGKQGFLSDIPYTHYSVLRTIEESWQLGLLGHAADPAARPMSDFFR